MGPTAASATPNLIHLDKFGGEGSGAGKLSAPDSVAVDSEGNVWVADTGHSRIQQFDSEGDFVRQFGAEGSGTGQFTGLGGIAVDAEDNLWVADHNRIQVFDPEGEFIHQVGGPGGGNGQFVRLQDLAIGPDGHIWALEAGWGGLFPSRVQEFDAEGDYLSQFGAPGSGDGQFKEAESITVDPEGNVWVADTGNNRVQVFDAEGDFIDKFGSKGSGNGMFSTPNGIAADPEGGIWVADTGNHRIQGFSAEGEYLSQFGTAGNNDGEFLEPRGVTTDSEGNLWIADTGNDRVQGFGYGAAPTLATNAATKVHQHDAILNATINSGNIATTYQFEYTDTADFEVNGFANASRIPAAPEDVGAGTESVEVEELVEGLESDISYHFRAVAENPAGSSEGDSEIFATSNGLPPACQDALTPASPEEPRDLMLRCTGTGSLDFEIVSEPEHGEISDLDTDEGKLVYAAEEEFIGVDEFTFRASNDAGASNTATATVDVCPFPGVRASGPLVESDVPGVELEIEAGLAESPCEPEVVLNEFGEPGQVTSLRVYIDEELIFSEERGCDEEAEVFCSSRQIDRFFQIPYAKAIGWHSYRVEAEDDLGNVAKPLQWTEYTPEKGTISSIPPKAEDSQGSKGCATPKDRYKRYVFRGQVVIGTDCADILGRYVQRNTKVYLAGAGDDVVRAGGEINVIRGEEGDDRIYAGRGNDKVSGQAGNDQIIGGSGDDELKGNDGGDIVAGSAGADEVFGNSGDDLIRGGGTADKLRGGLGENTLSFTDAAAPGFEFGTELFPGFPEPGGERGVYLDLGETPQAEETKNGVREYIRAFNGNTSRFGGGSDRIYVDAGTFQNVIGSPFADVIVGSGEANVIDGSGGPDIIEGRGGDDRIYGGADSDFVDGDGDQGAGNLNGGDGDDICLDGTEGAQACERESTAEGLKPTSSAAILVGRVNPDDPDNDTGIYVRGTGGADNLTATWDGGNEKPANDVVRIVAKGQGGTGRFDAAANGVSGCTVTATKATCSLDKIHTLTIDAGSGNDVIKAHGFPASVAVTLLGGADRDILHGGGESEDVLVDGPGEGKDDLYGFGDDDVFFANEGRDRLYGAGGSDLFVSSVACEDTIHGGGDRDNASWAQIRGAAKGNGEFEYPLNGAEVTLPEGSGWGEITRLGDGCAKDGQLKEIEFLEGSGGKDRLEADDGRNIVLGRSGKDILIGLGGDDNLLANNRDPASEDEDRKKDVDEELNCGGGEDTLLYDKPYDQAAIDETCEMPRPGRATQSSVISGIGSEATAEAVSTGIDEDVIGAAGDPEAIPPVAFFRFDEITGTVATNWIDEEASGIYEEGVALDEPGAIEESRGVHLDGEDDYIDLTDEWHPDDFRLFFCGGNVNGYSVEMWVKFDDAASGREELFSRSEGAKGLFLFRSGDGRLNLSVGDAVEAPTVSTDALVSAEAWHHIVATVVEPTGGCPSFAGTTGLSAWQRITLYVDGFPHSLGLDTSPFPPSTPSAHNIVGARKAEGSFANLLAATVDAVAIYGHPLDEADVQAHLAISEAQATSVVLVPPVDPEDGDLDEDGVGDSIDNCLSAPNAWQDDADADGVGDACQEAPDSDNDEVPDESDNCPEVANKEQIDSDGNGVGDACEEEE